MILCFIIMGEGLICYRYLEVKMGGGICIWGAKVVINDYFDVPKLVVLGMGKPLIGNGIRPKKK